MSTQPETGRILDLPPTPLPRLAPVVQSFNRQRVTDVPGAIKAELDRAGLPARLRPGMRVAVTAGSRGIQGIGGIIAAAVGYLQAHGTLPFVVAAMGSPGGGPAAGQREMLAELGITEATVGCPVIASDDTVVVGEPEPGLILYCDRDAFASDGILVLNRVKPHTSFRGRIESGLSKMLTVGLGKVPGATNVHRWGFGRMHHTIPTMAALALQKLPVLAGLAIIENAYDETARFEAVTVEQWFERERVLLQEAWASMPSLPVAEIDLLIIDEISKTFSGTGMDTNVVGRSRTEGMPEPDYPKTHRIFVRDLAEASHGNANGIGLADATTSRLFARLDRRRTYLNAVTSGNMNKVMVPMLFDSDQEAIAALLISLKHPDPFNARIVRIANSLHIEHILVSESLLPDLRPQATMVAPAQAMTFDGQGNLAGPDYHA